MTDQELKDLVASLVISQQKTDEQMKKTDEKLTRLGIHLGGVTKSQGKVYFHHLTPIFYFPISFLDVY